MWWVEMTKTGGVRVMGCRAGEVDGLVAMGYRGG